MEFKDIWPVAALAISIVLNFYLSAKNRDNSRSDKETDAINKLNTEMHTVNNTLTNIQNDLKKYEQQTSDIGVLRERIDNTKNSLTDIKAQMGQVQGMVQALIRNFKPDAS